MQTRKGNNFIMSLNVAEYLGQSVNIDEQIVPVPDGDTPNCPFIKGVCTKLKGKRREKPVCAVRKNDGRAWIVCPHRLCSTQTKIPLSEYQKDVLHKIGQTIFHSEAKREQILVRREVAMNVSEKSKYKADFVMVYHKPGHCLDQPRKVILEMQGGGETSQTGNITNHIKNWEKKPSNNFLKQTISAGTIETNAWRRQQEQFIVKGNIAIQTGAGIVFCVGAPLFDYLHSRVKNGNLRDLREHYWTLALIGFSAEEPTKGQKALQFHIDENRILFTNYLSFVQTLINQGEPQKEIFEGEFESLSGDTVNL